MPSSVSNSSGGGGGNGSGSANGKSTGPGSFRKIGGAWRRVGGWGGKGGKGSGASGTDGEGRANEDMEHTGEPTNESDMDTPLPQVDHQRCAHFVSAGYDILVRARRGLALDVPT